VALRSLREGPTNPSFLKQPALASRYRPPILADSRQLPTDGSKTKTQPAGLGDFELSLYFQHSKSDREFSGIFDISISNGDMRLRTTVAFLPVDM
jgi:hypothetical protein